MRVRKLSPTGDVQFGQGAANFYVNSALGVGQKVVTRLLLLQGEWYLDNSQGTPWFTKVFGYSNPSTRDLVIKNVILGTDNVNEITAYSSVTDYTARTFTVNASILTAFGATSITTSLPA